MMNSAASSPAHDRTGRWWRSLGLPTDDGQRSRLRKEYASKLSAHSASKGNDPLSESALESFVREIHRIETARGLSFPAAHPLAGAARSGLLDKAELMVALWFLEHSKEAERATAVARHAVLVLASVLTLQQQQQQQQEEAAEAVRGWEAASRKRRRVRTTRRRRTRTRQAARRFPSRPRLRRWGTWRTCATRRRVRVVRVQVVRPRRRWWCLAGKWWGSCGGTGSTTAAR
mmetsp:Transcript_960/g.1987  ORF Transcript_960/g.1987 Transcript_960/m.1987 type:complete len:231 (-) Transcript_960:600-1292(-)